jgi:hypothetical protein
VDNTLITVAATGAETDKTQAPALPKGRAGVLAWGLQLQAGELAWMT